MRVLVGVDGSTSSDAVIREVVRRPWPAGSQIALVTVVDPYFFTKAPLLLDEAKQSAQKALEEMANPLIETGLHASPMVILDNPRHALPRSASEWKADLVMMGSHGRGAVGRLLVGSTIGLWPGGFNPIGPRHVGLSPARPVRLVRLGDAGRVSQQPGTSQVWIAGSLAPFGVEDGVLAGIFAGHLGRIVIRGHGSSTSVLMDDACGR